MIGSWIRVVTTYASAWPSTDRHGFRLQRLLNVSLHLCQNDAPAEHVHCDAAPRFTEVPTLPRVRQETDQYAGKPLDVAGLDKATGFAVPHPLRSTSDVRRNNRQPGTAGFDKGY